MQEQHRQRHRVAKQDPLGKETRLMMAGLERSGRLVVKDESKEGGLRS